MMADGLTKTLKRAPFRAFTGMIGLEDQRSRLKAIRRLDELRE